MRPKSLTKMKNTLFISVFTATIITAITACGGNSGKAKSNEIPTDSMAYSIVKKAKGDSTLYGLACDGCTDSVVVFLPYEGGDPVTYEIIDALRMGKVFGRPKIGDRLALMINPADKEEAIVVAVKASDGENPGSTQAAGERIAAVLCRKACRQDESTRIGPGCRSILKVRIIK